MEELLSNFLISSWSYSKVAQFARNEKAFEMSYIYGIKSKSSATTIAGQAYHDALKNFFRELKKDGTQLELPELQKIAYDFIEDQPANYWKLQKTTPTMVEAKQKATDDVNAFLNNFYGELGTYIDYIDEVIDVELYCDEFLTINGVDIPMPCHLQIDLVVKTTYGAIAVLDHKTKRSFTDQDELKLSGGIQAITYVKGYESKTGINVDEVWFIENKVSKNKDRSPQLNAFKIKINKDIRRLYEAILYEPLKRMVEAVSDPDYCYIINESDNFVDKAEIYEFWAKTMIAEVEEFNIVPEKRNLIVRRLRKIRDASLATINPKIIRDFQKNAAEFIQYDLSNKNMTSQEKIEHILRSFGILVQVAHKFDGYSCNTFLLEISAGVKISSIHGHKLDIANALDVPTVRIPNELLVHEEKAYLAVEFLKKREKNLFFDPSALVGRKIPIGKDNFDNTIVWDLDNQSTPHVLICGATGSGKSVCIRATIEYALQSGIDEVIIFDPKYEFLAYDKHPKVSVYNEIIAIEEEMANLVKAMNTLVKQGRKTRTLVITDEFADAVSASRKGPELKIYEDVMVGMYANGAPKVKRECTGELKSLEENQKILLQKGRSVGFRIMSATQRASVKVITGDAKVNFPVQICFRVPKETDSRVVLDEPGAESLAGAGDGLMKSPEYKSIVRFQGFYKD
jgi:hypothetical protein